MLLMLSLYYHVTARSICLRPSFRTVSGPCMTKEVVPKFSKLFFLRIFQLPSSVLQPFILFNSPFPTPNTLF